MRTESYARMELCAADITTLRVDAIVNAANTRLAGGGGVDGAIHRAAGAAALRAACEALGGCPTGEARVTPGFALAARWIIHAVGPVYADGGQEAALLAAAYRNSLKCAVDVGAATVAFPAISTGIYGYPFEEACGIAFATVAAFLDADETLERVVFAYFGEEDLARARRVFSAFTAGRPPQS